MMAGLLKAVGEASLSAAVMILAVLVLRLRFQDRTPRRAFCLLWDLVLVRLLVLGALPSPVSVRRWLPAAGWLPETGAKPAAVTAAPPPMVSAVTEDVTVVQTVLITKGEGLPYLVEGTAFSPVTQAAPSLDWSAVLAGVWLAAALLLAGGFLWSHLRSRKVYAASLPCRDGFAANWLASHALRRPVQARVSDQIAAPLTYGVLYPVILLPRGMDWEDREALACVLSHEHTHIRRFDALRKVLLAAALCLHWFNPLVWAMYALTNRDIELACDEAVLRGGADRERYALALLSMEERRGRWSPSGSHFSGHALEERIKAIMKRKHISIIALAAVLVVMCITTTVFASAAPEGKAQQNKSAALSGNVASAVDDSVVINRWMSEGVEYTGDGERVWVNLEQRQTHYTSWSEGWQVEWWTYEDYKAWLEQEKKDLQSIIGERGYTGSTGWFTWDQKMVDETIAMYEGILEDIKNGALYSKAIVDKNGRAVEGVVLSSGDAVVSTRFENFAMSDYSDDAALLEELEAFGVTGDVDALTYKGQLVHSLIEGEKVDGGYTYGFTYENHNGTIDLQIQRAVAMGPDGYWDTSGKVTGVVSEREAGFDKVMTSLLGRDNQIWAVCGSGASKDADTIEARFSRYEKYGLVYLPRECGIGSATYGGQPVRSFADTKPDGGVFSFEDPYVENGLRVHTVYDESGKLTGLRAE